MWERRCLFIQHSLDGLEGKLTAHLPGPDLHVVESAIRARADQVPPNPETGIFDPYPARMADGLVELAATRGDGSLVRSRSLFTPISKLSPKPASRAGCPSSRPAQ